MDYKKLWSTFSEVLNEAKGIKWTDRELIQLMKYMERIARRGN